MKGGGGGLTLQDQFNKLMITYWFQINIYVTPSFPSTSPFYMHIFYYLYKLKAQGQF